MQFTPEKLYHNCSIVGFYSYAAIEFIPDEKEQYDWYLEIFSGSKLVMKTQILKSISAKDFYNGQLYWRLTTPIVFSNLDEEQYAGRVLYSVRSVKYSPKSRSTTYGQTSDFSWDLILFSRSKDYFLYRAQTHSMAVRYF